MRDKNRQLRLVEPSEENESATRPVAPDDAREQELILAQERLRRTKTLVAKILEDFPRDATLGKVLRKAVVERDQREQECDALAREIERQHRARKPSGESA